MICCTVEEKKKTFQSEFRDMNMSAEELDYKKKDWFEQWALIDGRKRPPWW